MKATQGQSPTALPRDDLVPLESILCTEELTRRPRRPPDYETENRALVSLAQALAESPRNILQLMADMMLEVFQAGSAGFSLLTKEDGGKRFYWPAIAGMWKAHTGGGTPRDFGPCGDVLDRNVPLLFRHFERRYPYLRPVTPLAVECLLVPFSVEGKAVGTIWAIAHDDRRKFDLEDLRQLVSLGTFASSAYQVTAFLDALDQQGETLRHSEERFRGTFENAAVGIAHRDLQGRFLRVNDKFCSIVEYSREELLQKTFRDVTHPDDLAADLSRHTALVREEGPSYVLEKRYVRKDGSHVWAQVFASVQRDAAGAADYDIAIIHDITERKRLEEEVGRLNQELQSRVDEMQAILDIVPVGIGIALDPECRRIAHNPYLSEVLGVPVWRNASLTAPADERPDNFRVFRDGQEVPPDQLPMQMACTGVEVRDAEIDVVRSDGDSRKLLCYVRPLKDAAGRVRGSVGAFLDITSRRRMEEALRASEERFRLLLRSIPQKIFTADANGDVDYFNQPWTEFTGRSFDQIKGWGWTQFIHPDDVDENVRRWQRSIETGEPFQLEHRFRRADGVYRWHLSRALAMRDAEGRVLMWFGANTDIDDQKRAAEAFKQAKESAEATNRAKDDFLANVSHEIRTPMNAILGMTELALDTPLSDDQRQCLRTVKSAADSLLGIINDLLDFAKIEAGKLELDPGEFSLRSAVGNTLRALAARAHRKGLELACQVRADVPEALIGDAGRLRQVLLNLVGNAIKFTEKGEVVVQVEGEAAAEPAGRQAVVLRFNVRDTGIGIPPDQQERIFRAFEQEDTSTTRKYGGTGLGLTIAARLVALMGGQISVTSAPGQGSTFAFTARFGLQPRPAEPAAAQPPALLRNLPVLLIDDNATNRHILLEWLRGWQMDPAAAGDGVAAMDALWEAAARGRPYALVLLDARMPDTDGLALAAQIRKRSELSAARIILLSSGDRPGDWDRLRELRIDAHLLKPVQQDELLDRIYQVMSRARGDEPREAQPAAGRQLATAPAPATKPLHILLAEDDEFNARFMEQLLARAGHRVRLTTNGREALRLAEEGTFDLLLLDIHMPELDGFGVVGAIRERERAAGGRLPVIALTARSRKEDRERCLTAGMDDFLTKPVAAAALLAAIDRLVSSHEVPKPPQAEARPSGGLLDPVAVLTACGDDAEGLRRMCQDFQTYAPARLAELGDALRDRDAPRLRQAAHKFCPLLLAFSTAAGNLASDLEDHAAQGQLEEAQPLVERLGTMTQELMRLVGGLSLETLRQQAGAAGEPGRTAGL